MKEQEEKELNGEAALPAEEFPVKPSEETNGDEEEAGISGATAVDDGPPCSLPGPEGDGSNNNSLLGKESQPYETAQGALGQVKAKVEVCKDESIGEGFSLALPVGLDSHCMV